MLSQRFNSPTTSSTPSTTSSTPATSSTPSTCNSSFIEENLDSSKDSFTIEHVDSFTDIKSTHDFQVYASKLGYSDGLVKQVLSTLGPSSTTEELLELLISFHTMLCPNESNALTKRRRDATHLPRYMLVQDCFYKGKDKMPFWVWVKRETIVQQKQ